METVLLLCVKTWNCIWGGNSYSVKRSEGHRANYTNAIRNTLQKTQCPFRINPFIRSCQISFFFFFMIVRTFSAFVVTYSTWGHWLLCFRVKMLPAFIWHFLFQVSGDDLLSYKQWVKQPFNHSYCDWTVARIQITVKLSHSANVIESWLMWVQNNMHICHMNVQLKSQHLTLKVMRLLFQYARGW